MKTVRWMPLSVLATLPALLGQGCPSASPTLTDLERRAINSAAEAAAALSQATTATQTPANDESAGQQDGSLTVGTCPAVTTSLALDAEEGLAATLTVNFGASPCSPAAMPGLSCSGSASGTFNGLARFIVLNFQSLTCGADVLSGSAEVSFAFSEVGVNLDGSFDLAWTSGGESITAQGQGSFGYDRAATASTIAAFSGSVTDAEGTYTATFSDVVVSYPDNGNLIPSAGVITLSGPDIRRLTIRFSADSPGTGDVEVSINGSAFMAVNLLSL